MKPEDFKIDKEKLVFANTDEIITDKELPTKPISFFRGALSRFARNKASIVAFIIICILVLFAIIGPFCTNYTVSYNDSRMSYCYPKSKFFSQFGIWDGTTKKETNSYGFYYDYAIGVETNHSAIKNQSYTTSIIISTDASGNEITTTYYSYKLDTYCKTGVIFKNLTEEEYIDLQNYQDETGIQVIYPMTDSKLRPDKTINSEANADANYWYQTEVNGVLVSPVLDENGDYINIYKAYTGKDKYTSKMRVEGEGNYLYNYASKNQTGYQVRISYYDYYVYYHSYVLQDGITEPCFLFGSTNTGQDIFTCLASGARFSFMLAILVSVVNLIVGAIYGAIEGYYGGKIDLVMERIVEILNAIPFMVVVTLLKYHLGSSSQMLVLFIAFFLTGWIGMAGRTRMQFYRFKNQEYVLAARTLGASDARIMFKHIFVNAIGTLITSCVLIIPSTIFSETTLSYLGIINLNSGSMTSVGTLLSNAQQFLASYPYMIAFPAVFICLLMLSFNLFGNGLRDAFNPSLRGSEE